MPATYPIGTVECPNFYPPNCPDTMPMLCPPVMGPDGCQMPPMCAVAMADCPAPMPAMRQEECPPMPPCEGLMCAPPPLPADVPLPACPPPPMCMPATYPIGTVECPNFCPPNCPDSMPMLCPPVMGPDGCQMPPTCAVALADCPEPMPAMRQEECPPMPPCEGLMCAPPPLPADVPLPACTLVEVGMLVVAHLLVVGVGRT